MAILDWYRVFVEVAECKNITKASERLFISQPAVTKCIKHLEDELGAPLFVRKHNGVELSEFGKAIYENVSNSIATLENTNEQIEKVRRGELGELKIATTTSNAALLLADQLKEFCATFPKVELKIIRIKEEEIGTNQKYDFILTDREFVPKSARIVKNYDVQYAIIASGKSARNKILASELGTTNMILTNKSYTSRQNIDNFFLKNGISVKAKYEVDNYAMAVLLVKIGLGIGIVNPDYFTADIKNGELKVLETDAVFEPRKLTLIKTINAPKSTIATNFEHILANR